MNLKEGLKLTQWIEVKLKWWNSIHCRGGPSSQLNHAMNLTWITVKLLLTWSWVSISLQIQLRFMKQRNMKRITVKPQGNCWLRRKSTVVSVEGRVVELSTHHVSFTAESRILTGRYSESWFIRESTVKHMLTWGPIWDSLEKRFKIEIRTQILSRIT